MPEEPTKRAAHTTEEEEDDDVYRAPDEDDEKPKPSPPPPPPAKRAKRDAADAAPTATANATVGGKMPKVEAGVTVIKLSDKRFVQVRKWKRLVQIDVREFYEDKDGELRPGQKGVALSPEQWEILKNSITTIDSAIENLK